jgi:hypothetical protein
MNISKNMEAIFVVATLTLGVAAYASAALPSHTTSAMTPTAVVKVSTAQQAALPTYVVVVTAKRLTPAEKAALDE